MGWGLEEASLIDLASRHVAPKGNFKFDKLMLLNKLQESQKSIVWVVPRIRMVASHFQTFKALLDEWEARERDPPTH